jgi:AAHS family benzoate transporter-like MFS transporter
MSQPHAVIAENPQKEARTANWVAFVICTALLFDWYDLVIYGTVLP